MSDPRFQEILKDPRFRAIKKKNRDVKVDKRFDCMFVDKKFKQPSDIDKRGNKLEKNTTPDLKAFYDVEKSDHSDEDVDEQSKIDLKRNVRGEFNSDDELLSSSSDEESSEEEEDVIHQWGELDHDAPRADVDGNRLALCNVDWDRINATDLFVLANSFKHDNGVIKSVKIFKSEYGKERLSKEVLDGPAELTEKKLESDEESDQNEDSEFITEKLRQYQMNRLKYYYAVVECDNSTTAKSLYDELDGLEYESSASTIDVRMIPEDVTFDDKPSNVCTVMPDPVTYMAPQFVTSALQQSKVSLTWDETDPRRQEKMANAFKHAKEGKDDRLADLIASSESEYSEEEKDDLKFDADENNKISKYKALLKSIDSEDEEGGNEWSESDNVAMNKALLADDDSEEEEHEESNEIKKKAKDPKKKKKSKKVVEPTEEDSELKLLVEDGAEKSHFNFKNLVDDGKNKSKKAKAKGKDNFEVTLYSVTFCSTCKL